MPSVSIEIVDSGNSPTVEESYTLTCVVSGASVTTFKWKKDEDILSEIGSTLSFSALRLSDAGQYVCEVSVYIWTYTATHVISLSGKCDLARICMLHL